MSFRDKNEDPYNVDVMIVGIFYVLVLESYFVRLSKSHYFWNMDLFKCRRCIMQ